MMMSKADVQKNAAFWNLVYGVLLVLFSTVCFFFGHRAFEAVTLQALLNGAKPEALVTLVICMMAPIALVFTLGMYLLAMAVKGFDPTNPERVVVAAKSFVAAKVIVYQELSDEACAEKILNLSTVKTDAFQAAVKAELQAIGLLTSATSK
jgi:hypothetical protein